jgi:predicted ATPase/lambda repressor-like predicted transcriptional regulator
MRGEDARIRPLLAGGRHTWDSTQIAALREMRGWTQETLAERSGLSVRTIRNLELGVVQNPRRSSVDLLAHALGVKVEDEHEPRYHEPVEIFDRTFWRGPQPPTAAVVGDPSEHGKLAETVRTNRLTTFLGPGGIGKTRLALSVAAEIGHLFRDGVAVVELGDLAPERHSQGSQAGAVMQRVRRQLRWGRVPGSIELTAVDSERELNLLLVLDNAEHIPDGVTAVTRDLLGTYAGMQVLITARRRLTERLGVNREIQPLSAEAAPGEAVSRAPAVELVLTHLGTGSRAAAEVGDDLPLVAELCRRLGGLPRYLEFAAERMRTIPVQQLLAYGPTMEMLWSSDHALLRHQRSVAESIQWNVDLLPGAHGRLLARIAALPMGRFTLDDVVAEYDRLGMTEADPLTLLSDLHETWLILADPDDRYCYRLAPFVAAVMDRIRSDGDGLERLRSAMAS